MTNQEALAEAQRRWGTGAMARDRFWRDEKDQRFLVSDCTNVYGVGDSWEAAFEAADARKDYWLEIQWENTELRERLSEAAEVMAETGRIADTPAAKRAWWENTELRERLSEAAEVMAETGRIADTPAAKRAWVEGKPADPKGHWTR